ncbi:MAG: alanine racemase [Oscillospiraceae bacterium]
MRRCWVEIDTDKLKSNFALIKSLAGDAGIMAIVKADAYGHGDVQCARLFADEGAQWLGVSSIEEAMHLRGADIQTPILILGYTLPENAEILFNSHITQTVLSLDYAKALSRAACDACVTVDAHIKLDTGMGRIGFDAFAGTAADIAKAMQLPGLNISGIFTHFSVADSTGGSDIEYTKAQHTRFCNVLAELSSMGYNYDFVHCCNSAALAAYGSFAHTLVRPGIILYGENPSDDVTLARLMPAMSLKAVVAHVKTMSEGRDISYGRSYTTTHATTVATLTVGYADGYPRALSGKGTVSIHGKPCPVIGKVCMDQMMVDVTGLKNVKPGDIATVFGAPTCDSAAHIAALTNTVTYEILCGINRRVPRIYTENGAEIYCVDYLA